LCLLFFFSRHPAGDNVGATDGYFRSAGRAPAVLSPAFQAAHAKQRGGWGKGCDVGNGGGFYPEFAADDSGASRSRGGNGKNEIFSTVCEQIISSAWHINLFRTADRLWPPILSGAGADPFHVTPRARQTRGGNKVTNPNPPNLVGYGHQRTIFFGPRRELALGQPCSTSKRLNISRRIARGGKALFQGTNELGFAGRLRES